MEGVSFPDNKQYTLLILSGHETHFTEFSNTTEIHCIFEITTTMDCQFIL